MRFLVRRIGILMIGAAILLTGVGQVQSADELPALPIAEGQSDDPAAKEILRWPELGLNLEYPADWVLDISDRRFEFVLFGPIDEATQTFPYMLVQSGSYNYKEQTLNAFVAGLFSLEDDSQFSQVAIGDTEGLQFKEARDGQDITYIAFSHAEGQLALMSFVISEDEIEKWQPTFDEIKSSIQFAPLELDTVLLNEQLQTSFEADGSLTVGSEDAPVLIVEFYDVACPHCVTYSGKVNRLVQDYVQTGKARLTLGVLDIIGGEVSTTMTAVQLCAAKYGVGWDVHELIFELYESGGGYGAYTLENILESITQAELNVNLEELEACVSDEAILEQIQANVAWARDLQVSSTPSILFGTTRNDLAKVSVQEGVDLGNAVPLLMIYDYLDQQLEQE